MILWVKKGTFSVFGGLFAVHLPHALIQIPFWRRRGSLSDFVVLADEDVLREGAHVVGFQKEDVVAKV